MIFSIKEMKGLGFSVSSFSSLSTPYMLMITGGPRLVRILGPGKNRTSEIRTSGYYIQFGP